MTRIRHYPAKSKPLFFGNYFIGILSVALAIESSLQLGLPLGSLPFYLLLFCAPVAYYNYAYMGSMPATVATTGQLLGHAVDQTTNARTAWMQAHKGQIRISQLILVTVSIGLSAYLLLSNLSGLKGILELPLLYRIIPITAALVAILYYGLLPGVFCRFKLRDTGWLKPFMIGFVWASTVGVLPVMFLAISTLSPFDASALPEATHVLWGWLFVKNWMFCTVNAIMFDIKDYETDMNHRLKTFVVRAGIRRTIAFIILPLLIVGLAAFLIFAYGQNFSPLRIILNMIPFLLTITVAFWMYRKKEILFYLIVIDGLLLVKALCGSLAAIWG